MRLGLSAFVMHERLPIGQMYVLRRGMVVKLYRFLGKGRVWGEDSLLEARLLALKSDADTRNPRLYPQPAPTPAAVAHSPRS